MKAVSNFKKVESTIFEKPVLLCIGAQKSGTTWLGHALSNKTSVFVSPLKELHYFDRYSEVESIRRAADKRHYNRLLSTISSITALRDTHPSKITRLLDRCYIDSDKKYVGFLEKYCGSAPAVADLTPEYASLTEDGFNRISLLLPKALPIFIMRDPVQRLWSAAKHRSKISNDSRAIQNLDDLLAFAKIPAVHALSNYSRTLRALLPVFPDSKIEFFENIFASAGNAEQFVAGLLKDVGLPEDLDSKDILQPVYQSKSNNLPEQWESPLRENLDWVYEGLREMGFSGHDDWTAS